MNVLVIAPHPDDETLGCGGTLLKHKAAGDQVSWLIMTSMAKESGYTPEQIKNRAGEIETISRIYGFHETVQLGIPTTTVDGVPMRDLVKMMKAAFDQLQPEIVYLPFYNDNHSDHRSTFEAAYNCAKTFRFPSVKKILMMEILSETEFASPADGFVPNYFVDISDYLEKKIATMKLYTDEIKAPPFPRSEENIRALATYRGSTVNCASAESFMILKEVW